MEIHILVGRRLVRQLGSIHGKPSLSAHPPANAARRLACGNARTAALPPRETTPIDAALMDIATPIPGRLNRAKRLRVLRARAHYIEIGVSVTARFGSTSAGKTGER